MPKRSNAGRVYSGAKRARTVKPRVGFRRRVYRRRPRARVGRPSRGMRQSTYLFKRQVTEVVRLSTSTLGTTGWVDAGDGGVYKQWTFNLDQLAATATSKTDFTALFKRYKIAAVKLDMSFNNTASPLVPAGQGNSPGAQLQVYTTPNRTGRARDPAVNPLTEAELLNTQAKRKRLALNGGRSLKTYMRTTQLNMVYVSATDTDYGVQRPQYLSTGETGAEHYGLEMYINRVDGQALSSNIANEQSVRITTTYYLAFKGVE